MRHVERLQGDIELVAGLAEVFRGNDSLSMLHADLVGAMKANLIKAQASESRFASFEQVNEWIGDAANGVGLSFTGYAPPHNADAARIVDELQHLRAMLARQVVLGDDNKDGAPNLKNLRRVANTIIRQEKSLFTICVDSGIYLTHEAAWALWRRWFTSVDKGDVDESGQAEWSRRVDAYLASVNFVQGVAF
jgi:hypothetical protein